jgi:hypothetical protein
MMLNKRWHLQIKSRMNITERKYFTMQNNNYQSKHPRGSSPPIEEIELVFDKWLLGLRSIKKNPQDLLASNQKEVLTSKFFGSLMQPN